MGKPRREWQRGARGGGPATDNTIDGNRFEHISLGGVRVEDDDTQVTNNLFVGNFDYVFVGAPFRAHLDDHPVMNTRIAHNSFLSETEAAFEDRLALIEGEHVGTILQRNARACRSATDKVTRVGCGEDEHRNPVLTRSRWCTSGGAPYAFAVPREGPMLSSSLRRVACASALSVCSLALACDPGGVLPIGEHPIDGVKLKDSPNLAHIADALDSEDLDITALFGLGDGVTFQSAPTPTTLLSDTAALDEGISPEGRTALAVATYNVALLDVKLFGLVQYKRSPLLDERKELLPDLVFSQGFDILLLQEVWSRDDADLFVTKGEDAGYLGFMGPRDEYSDGLLIFVRESAMADGAAIDEGAAPYLDQDGTEYWPGPGIKRGYQWVSFEHVDIGLIRVFNTHMRAFSNAWQARMTQARELGIAVDELADADEIAFVGGDLNSGPYYRNTEWKLPDGNVETWWWQNAISYPLLLEYGGLVDVAVMGRSVADATSDISLGDRVVNDPERALEVPGAQDGYCDDTPHTTFTASDCNSIYFEQYAGTEYPARLDHIHARDPDGRIAVENTQLLFTDKISVADTESEPSDHYGVVVNLRVAPE